jgi:hypothetical protein
MVLGQELGCWFISKAYGSISIEGIFGSVLGFNRRLTYLFAVSAECIINLAKSFRGKHSNP